MPKKDTGTTWNYLELVADCKNILIFVSFDTLGAKRLVWQRGRRNQRHANPNPPKKALKPMSYDYDKCDISSLKVAPKIDYCFQKLLKSWILLWAAGTQKTQDAQMGVSHFMLAHWSSHLYTELVKKTWSSFPTMNCWSLRWNEPILKQLFFPFWPLMQHPSERSSSGGSTAWEDLWCTWVNEGTNAPTRGVMFSLRPFADWLIFSFQFRGIDMFQRRWSMKSGHQPPPLRDSSRHLLLPLLEAVVLFPNQKGYRGLSKNRHFRNLNWRYLP